MERWRPIEDFKNYEVSSYGRVRNVKTGRILKQNLNEHGYYQIMLYHNRKYKTLRVHRLVAHAFCNTYGLDTSCMDVNHIDGNKTNNRSDNLEWCTRSENIIHGMRTGLISTNNFGKELVRVRIIETGEVFDSVRECARYLKCPSTSISACLNGRQNRCRGYHFEYA